MLRTTHTSCRTSNVSAGKGVAYTWRQIPRASINIEYSFQSNTSLTSHRSRLDYEIASNILSSRFYSDSSKESNTNHEKEKGNEEKGPRSVQPDPDSLNEFEKSQEEAVYGEKGEKLESEEQQVMAWFMKHQGRERRRLRSEVHRRILRRGGQVSPKEFHRELEALYRLRKMNKDWEGHLKQEQETQKKKFAKRINSWVFSSILFALFLLVIYQWERQLDVENAELIMDLLGDTRPERRVAAYEAAALLLNNGRSILTLLKQPSIPHQFSPNDESMEEYPDLTKEHIANLPFIFRLTHRIRSAFSWYKPQLQPLLNHVSTTRTFPHTMEEFASILVSGIVDTDGRVRHAARSLLFQGATSYVRFEESLIKNGLLTQLLDNFASSSTIHEKHWMKSVDQDTLDSRVYDLFQVLLSRDEYRRYLLKQPDFLDALVSVAKSSSSIVNGQSNPLTTEGSATTRVNSMDSENKDRVEAELSAMMSPQRREDSLSLARFKLELVMNVLIEFMSSAELLPAAVSEIKLQRAINYLSVLDVPPPTAQDIDTPDLRRLRQVKRAAQLLQSFEPSGHDYSLATEKLQEVFSFSNLNQGLHSYHQTIEMPTNLVRMFGKKLTAEMAKQQNVASVVSGGGKNGEDDITDSQGTDQGLVPRDISPQDLGAVSGMMSSMRERFRKDNLLKFQWGYALFCIPLSFYITRRRYLRGNILGFEIGRTMRYWSLVSLSFPFRELWKTPYGVQYANHLNLGTEHAPVSPTEERAESIATHIGVGVFGESFATLADILAVRGPLQTGSIMYSYPYWLLFPIRMMLDTSRPIRLTHLLSHAYFTRSNPFHITTAGGHKNES